jgi:hypothetical protein
VLEGKPLQGEDDAGLSCARPAQQQRQQLVARLVACQALQFLFFSFLGLCPEALLTACFTHAATPPAPHHAVPALALPCCPQEMPLQRRRPPTGPRSRVQETPQAPLSQQER